MTRRVSESTGPYDLIFAMDRRYNVLMTQRDSTSSRKTAALEALSEEDRVWLAERLVEYRELLEYLHAN